MNPSSWNCRKISWWSWWPWGWNMMKPQQKPWSYGYGIHPHGGTRCWRWRCNINWPWVARAVSRSYGRQNPGTRMVPWNSWFMGVNFPKYGNNRSWYVLIHPHTYVYIYNHHPFRLIASKEAFQKLQAYILIGPPPQNNVLLQACILSVPPP